ncbi:4-vinyl reductase [Cupriavidus sp. P-10]|uniref:V4R domain-containing protein n=1 Tax=Cupriavidus sp. P-10 TaxID=2027911 RepID=UPI000EBD1939|nr:4-vinyl reductase [Cupriavidus sp. P-10]BDB26306.1 4-vinyl reductase [Cupriavidus sp. P-10]
MATPLAQRLEFDTVRGEVRDQDRRYLLMRPDVLMGMLRLLDGAVRRDVLAAFAESTARHGRRSILAYLAGLGAGGGESLQDLICQTSPALGWGRWDFERHGECLVLNVFNSPFAAGYGPSSQPVCAPIAGMFRTIAAIVLERPVQVEETACAAMEGHATCRFVARPDVQGVSS